MTVTVTVTPQSRQVLLRLTQHRALWTTGLRNAFHEIGQINKREVKRLITQGPKTGRVYMIGGRPHQASAPGQPPANLTGRLRAGVDYKVRAPHQLSIGTTTEYGRFLESGTSKMRPRPFLLAAVNNVSGDVIEALLRGVQGQIGGGGS